MDVLFDYRLIFLRHGETDWNLAGRLQGQRDIPLNGRGASQASGSGHAALKYLALPVEQILQDIAFFASPLVRARQTMALARKAMRLPAEPVTFDDRLKEISFGDWEGMTWKEVANHDGDRAKARQRDLWGYAPPNGESYCMVAERLKPWLQGLDGDALVVAHGGIARALMVLIGGIAPDVATTADVFQGRALLFHAKTIRWL